jgi:hypothetical protein
MKTQNIYSLHNVLSILARDKACSGLAAYRCHRNIAELTRVIDGVRDAYNKTLAEERNGESKPEEIAALEKRINDQLMQQDEPVTVAKLPVAGIDWGKGDPGALQELMRLEMIEGEYPG